MSKQYNRRIKKARAKRRSKRRKKRLKEFLSLQQQKA